MRQPFRLPVRYAALLASVLLLFSACRTNDTVVVSQPDDQAADTSSDAAASDADDAADTDGDDSTDSGATDTGESDAEEPSADPEPAETPADDPSTPAPEPTPTPEPEDSAPVSGDDAAAIAAVAEQLAAEGDVPPGVDVNCFATALVNGLGGTEGLARDFGLTVEDITGGADPGDIILPVEQAQRLADGILACGLEEVFIQEFAGSGFGPEESACLIAALDDAIIRDIMAAQFVSPEDAAALESDATAALFDAMFAAFLDCEIDPTGLGG